MGTSQRERVTVDLRGLGAWLHAQAAARHVTAASLMRQALLASLDDASVEPVPAGTRREPGRHPVKLTLRLSAAHARNLSARARAADSSLGGYVAGLLEGVPPVPLPLDHTEAVLKLSQSTDRLARLNADLITFIRSLDASGRPVVPQYRLNVTKLIDIVREHLAESAALVAALKPARRR